MLIYPTSLRKGAKILNHWNTKISKPHTSKFGMWCQIWLKQEQPVLMTTYSMYLSIHVSAALHCKSKQYCYGQLLASYTVFVILRIKVAIYLVIFKHSQLSFLVYQLCRLYDIKWYPIICLWKTMRNLGQDSQLPDWDSNPGHHKYKAIALTTQCQWSASAFSDSSFYGYLCSWHKCLFVNHYCIILLLQKTKGKVVPVFFSN
jgi:hypothetical protein